MVDEGTPTTNSASLWWTTMLNDGGYRRDKIDSQHFSIVIYSGEWWISNDSHGQDFSSDASNSAVIFLTYLFIC